MGSTCSVTAFFGVFAAFYAYVIAYGYTQVYTQIRQHTHMHKAVIGCVQFKKILSRRRQLDYSLKSIIEFNRIMSDGKHCYKVAKFANQILSSSQLTTYNHNLNFVFKKLSVFDLYGG